MGIVETLATIRPSSTFLSLHEYRSATTGEVADHQIVFHTSYGNALERSLEILEAFPAGEGLEAQAREELIASYRKSLDKVRGEPLEVIGEHYDRVLDGEGNPIRGCKIHRGSGELHLFGMHLRKRVIVPGVYKEVKSRPLTLAKDKLRAGLPVEKFRQFIIREGQVREIRVESLTILPE